MTEFLKNMVSSSEEVSSKRVISLLGLLIFVGVIVCSICGLNVPDVVYYTLTSIILGSQGLTLFNKNKINTN